MTLDPEICYPALSARDPRFDGVFFVGVTTTGIYCRPVCPARLPAADRCRFFANAAAAEGAGFRPCLRCRPERAPGRSIMDARPHLAKSAAAQIVAGALNDASVEELAAKLHVGSRQLRRAVKREYGVSPVQLAQTHRLLLAKRLLAESNLSMTRVAFASGFSSVRRFNALFRERYRMRPRDVQRQGHGSDRSDQAAFTLTLEYRPPLDWEALLGFLAARAIPEVESVAHGRYMRTMAIGEHRGWVAVQRAPDGTDALAVDVSLSLLPALMPLLARLRDLFDLDAEPVAIAAHLGTDARLAPHVRRRPGLRVPGAVDGFELALRAILGQQVSVQAARTLAGRVVTAFGAPGETGHETLTRFPVTAARLAEATPEQVAAVGIPRTRAECIVTLARAIDRGEVRLEPGADVDATLAWLQGLRGVGPWTAQYIALRALHWPDAFPHGDLGLRKALDAAKPAQLLRDADRWRPWRAYAALHLWQSLSDVPQTGSTRDFALQTKGAA